MKNKIIDVYKIANRLVSITVENPDFSKLRMNQFVDIGGKKYKVHSIPFFRPTPPKTILKKTLLQSITPRTIYLAKE